MPKALRSQDKWDVRFLELAQKMASFSKDPSTKVGAIIARERVQVSCGFNGFPQGMPDDPVLYDNRTEKYSRIIHAEMNAFIFAERPVRGTTIYTWPFATCDRCAVHLLQAGIREFVFPKLPERLIERWGESVERSKRYFDEMRADWIEVELPEGG